jgi:hypothetical protein
MIKTISIILGVMLLLISVCTFGFYKLVGSYSGQDAMCISGILAGLAVGLWQGKLNGISVVVSILISSASICVPLVVLSIFMAHAHQDLVESFAFFSIGFSLLFFYIVGCGWGKHLTRLST